MKLDEYSKHQLNEVRHSVRDKDYVGSVAVPLLQNVLGGVAISVIIITVVTMVLYTANVELYTFNDVGGTQHLTTYVFQVAIILSAVGFGKVWRIMSRAKMESFMDVYLAFFAAMVGYAVQVDSLALTAQVTWWLLFAVTCGVVYAAGLTAIRFSSEESVIARTIFFLGRASNKHVIASQAKVIEELRFNTVQEGANQSSVVNDREKAHADAMLLYTAGLETGVAPTYAVMRNEYNVGQERVKAARSALIQVRAVDSQMNILDRDTHAVAIRLARYIAQTYIDTGG